ncbi:MAG: C39 family peptidase [Minisyncoccia bacterium]
MLLPVKFYSQYSSDIPYEWRSRVCALAAIKIVTDFLGVEKLEVEKLIIEGQIINGYDEKFGWNHEAIVRIFRNHGFNSFRQEFKSRKINLETKESSESEFEPGQINFGIFKIKSALDHNLPVVISVLKRFNEPNTYHMAVVVGYELTNDGIKGFYITDPEKLDAASGEAIFLPLNEFISAWRKLAIFIEK